MRSPLLEVGEADDERRGEGAGARTKACEMTRAATDDAVSSEHETAGTAADSDPVGRATDEREGVREGVRAAGVRKGVQAAAGLGEAAAEERVRVAGIAADDPVRESEGVRMAGCEGVREAAREVGRELAGVAGPGAGAGDLVGVRGSAPRSASPENEDDEADRATVRVAEVSRRVVLEVREPARLAPSRAIFSGATKMPWFSSHVKYWRPSTHPLFLPAGSSSVTPQSLVFFTNSTKPK